MDWTVANEKYCMNNWRVYATPDGWRISHRKYKELPNYIEVDGLIFDTSDQALEYAEKLANKYERRPLCR